MSWPVWAKSTGRCHAMIPKYIERKQHARGMKLPIRMLEEIHDHVRALPRGMLGLEIKAGVFLIALGGKSHVVELNFVCAGLRRFHRQCDVVFLNFGLGWIGPNQLAVFAPGLPGAFGFHRQLRMCDYKAFIAKNRHTGNRMHALRMQKLGELRQVADRDVVATR